MGNSSRRCPWVATMDMVCDILDAISYIATKCGI